MVSFNEDAFESYGREGDQGLNAPVSRYAAFAYAEALGYLLSRREHHIRLGDTTIVYWGEAQDQECSEFISAIFSGESFDDEKQGETEDLIDDVMKRLSAGRHIAEFNLDENFWLFGGFCGRDSGIGPAQRAKTTIWN